MSVVTTLMTNDSASIATVPSHVGHRTLESWVMSCVLCASGNQTEFLSEINMHFSGLKDLGRPSVLVFPKLVVCLDCGLTQFTLPETELRLLRESAAASEGCS